MREYEKSAMGGWGGGLCIRKRKYVSRRSLQKYLWAFRITTIIWIHFDCELMLNPQRQHFQSVHIIFVCFCGWIAERSKLMMCNITDNAMVYENKNIFFFYVNMSCLQYEINSIQLDWGSSIVWFTLKL